MRGLDSGMERDVVALPVPDVTLVREKVVHLVVGAKKFTEFFNRRLNESTLCVNRIEIHDHEHNALPRRCQLAVKKKCLVVDRMKTQVVVEVEGAIFAPNSVQLGDEWLDVPRRIPIALFQLILFG